jgi:general secretion pathway protein F
MATSAPSPARLRLAPPPPPPAASQRRRGKASRAAATRIVGDLSVLLKAGLPLDRALALGIANVEDREVAAGLELLLADVRQGQPLSRAMAARGELFPPEAVAIAEAGEANGRLGDALARAAQMLDEAEQLRKTISGAMTYPLALGVIAIGVIMVMLLFVVPQFEGMFRAAQGELPASTKAVMAASRLVREQGWLLLGGLAVAVFALNRAGAAPGFAARRDRLLLRLPLVGALIQRMEAARFARTLGALLEGGVGLPQGFALAERTLVNAHIRSETAPIAAGIKEGGGLAAPLAAAGIFPPIAIGFIRTGEESSQLGPMLSRLADVLDRDVRQRLQRLIAVLTPAITVVLGLTVAVILASVMTAILGFNDLAVQQ